MIQSTNTSSTAYYVPTASITVNRNRMKSYGNVVYMKSGTNFEIEIFNPLQTRVMASIKIDGKLISASGIVVNPGQRIYLERWVDEPKKLVFSTYEVENTSEAKNAIANNGKVEVNFFEEVNKYFNPTQGNWGVIYTGNHDFTTNAPAFYYNNTVTNGSTNVFLTNTSSSVGGSMEVREASIETGRTEAGSSSSQNLTPVSGDFNTFSLCSVSMQILPESQKPVEIEKIRSYCTDCGTRVRSSAWNFCPSCGEKL